MSVSGADKVRRQLRRLKPEMRAEIDKVNERTGKEVIRLAKILIPENSGASRQAIKGETVADGYEIDFGDKAKVIEGRRGPRPFVNPALAITRKRRKNAQKRAVNKVIKKALR